MMPTWARSATEGGVHWNMLLYLVSTQPRANLPAVREAAEELFSRSARGEFSAILVMTAGEAFAACGAASPDEMLIVSWGLPFLRIGLPGDAGLRIAGRGEASLRGMIRAVGEALILRDNSFMV